MPVNKKSEAKNVVELLGMPSQRQSCRAGLDFVPKRNAAATEEAK